MKKKIWIPIAAAVFLLAILFVPIPMGSYDDGGTREWVALTYKIVDWNRLTVQKGAESTLYEKTRVYFGADKNKSIDELWEYEITRNAHDCDDDMNLDAKPVIYLYPKEEMIVSVKLDYSGRLTCTYPRYDNGWTVTAAPDGTLTDANGQTYNYLYWEGETYTQYDLSKGFCVKREDTAAFLEDALAKLGLNRREANEFIVFWLPMMQENPYNIISFQTDIYTESAKLEITPAPDTLIRIFMAYKASDEFVEMEAQELSAPEREGFTVIEWGGTEVDEFIHSADN